MKFHLTRPDLHHTRMYFHHSRQRLAYTALWFGQIVAWNGEFLANDTTMLLRFPQSLYVKGFRSSSSPKIGCKEELC